MKKIRTYSDLRRLETFEDRYNYLRLGGIVGHSTFGFDRYLNQIFYRSPQWKSVREKVIIRDSGCDLGIWDREIFDRIIIHHMNPLSVEDFEKFKEEILDPEFLICVTHNTHLAIHFGDESQLLRLPPERRPGDTLLWKKGGLL